MPYCQHCGNEIDERARFCPACGEAVSSEKASPAPKKKGRSEKKTLRFAPKQEQTILKEMNAFGWELVARNEIYNSKEVLDSAVTVSYYGIGSTSFSSHDVTTHYISALFERKIDEIPEYEKVAKLNKEFEEAGKAITYCSGALVKVDKLLDELSIGAGGYLAWAVFSFIGFGLSFGLMFAFQDRPAIFYLLLGVSIFLFVLFGISIPLLIRKRKKNKQEAEAERKRLSSKLAQAVKKRAACIKDSKIILGIQD